MVKVYVYKLFNCRMRQSDYKTYLNKIFFTSKVHAIKKSFLNSIRKISVSGWNMIITNNIAVSA